MVTNLLLGDLMNLKHFTKHIAVLSASSALMLAAGASSAADLGTVTITHDKDVAARTNMPRPAKDSNTLNVTFDRDVAKRTNMQRDSNEPAAPVTVTQDRAVM